MKSPSRRGDTPPARNAHLRQLIASTAARLMAEDGIDDYPLAKRKAARQVGASDSDILPSNAEVESALRAYQALYHPEEQKERLQELREKALEVMVILQAFHPYLTGPVLSGTASRYASIDLQLYPDSAKEVEIFLLNRDIPFQHLPPRHERVEAVLQLALDNDLINLFIYPPQDERSSNHAREGRPRERAKAEAVQALLAAG